MNLIVSIKLATHVIQLNKSRKQKVSMKSAKHLNTLPLIITVLYYAYYTSVVYSVITAIFKLNSVLRMTYFQTILTASLLD